MVFMDIGGSRSEGIPSFITGIPDYPDCIPYVFHTSVNSTSTVLFIPSLIAGPYYLVFCFFVNIAAIIAIISDKMWRRLPEDHEAVCKY